MIKKHKPLTSRKKAVLAARCLEEKQASEILVIDVSTITSVADYFVIGTGNSNRQIKACAEFIDDSLSESGEDPHHVEGMTNLEWVLMDYGDVLIHIFDKDARMFYGLERLWGDGRKVDYRIRKRKSETGSG